MKLSNSNFNKLFIIIAFTLGSISSQAQEKKDEIVWPEDGKYRVDTIYNKKNPYNLFVSAGVVAEGDLFGGASGFGAYVRGRYMLARSIMVAANIIISPNAILPANISSKYDYHVVEARLSIPFKRSNEPVNVSKKLYTYTFSQGGNNYKRTYSANFPVMASTYQCFTASIGQSHRYYTQGFDSAARSFNIEDAGGNVVHKRATLGYSTMTLSFGYTYSQGLKFKGRVYSNIEGSRRKKIVRSKSIIDMSAEILYGITVADKNIIGINDGSGVKYDDNLVNQYKITSAGVNKSNLGFRFAADLKKSIFSIKMEMGSRPGITHDYKNGTARVENDKWVRGFSRAYLQMGVGIGIGAL
jgi:hypothetical protein